MDEDALDAAREAVAATRAWREQMRHDWGDYREPEEILDAAVGELLAERDRLRAVVEHAVEVLGKVEVPPAGLLSVVSLMRLALDGSADMGDHAEETCVDSACPLHGSITPEEMGAGPVEPTAAVAAERERIWTAIRSWTEVAHRLDDDGQPVVVEGTEFRPLAPFSDETPCDRVRPRTLRHERRTRGRRR